jgi:3-dehydroquinate synthase
MKQQQFAYSSNNCTVYFDTPFSDLQNFVSSEVVLITDEHVYQLHLNKFKGYKTIVIKAGEEYKQQATIDSIINQLIALQADRSTLIVGVGGGVVTDITGFAASVYMRGMRFGFVPTTILAMVDASIGGKNGIDVGAYKNLVGTIRQPEFLLYDYSFLQTLPKDQWVNGFAEIIKHACIKDTILFKLLQESSVEHFMNDAAAFAELVEINVRIKSIIVEQDEFEQGDRKLLNFGHTFGHAIENIYHLPHGHAVSIGIIMACTISEEINNFPSAEKAAIKALLEKYQLPTVLQFEKQQVWNMMIMDKKRMNDSMSFILLNSIGDGIIKQIPMIQLESLVHQNL